MSSWIPPILQHEAGAFEPLNSRDTFRLLFAVDFEGVAGMKRMKEISWKEGNSLEGKDV